MSAREEDGQSKAKKPRLEDKEPRVPSPFQELLGEYLFGKDSSSSRSRPPRPLPSISTAAPAPPPPAATTTATAPQTAPTLDQIKCPICWETKTHAERYALRCQHVFCIVCLDGHFVPQPKGKWTCPVCRDSVLDAVAEDIFDKCPDDLHNDRVYSARLDWMNSLPEDLWIHSNNLRTKYIVTSSARDRVLDQEEVEELRMSSIFAKVAEMEYAEKDIVICSALVGFTIKRPSSKSKTDWEADALITVLAKTSLGLLIVEMDATDGTCEYAFFDKGLKKSIHATSISCFPKCTNSLSHFTWADTFTWPLAPRVPQVKVE